MNLKEQGTTKEMLEEGKGRGQIILYLNYSFRKMKLTNVFDILIPMTQYRN